MSQHAAITTIAKDAVDHLELALSYIEWFDSLSHAINCSLKEGSPQHAKRLASVVQHLASDYRIALDSDVKNLNEELNTLELRG